MKKLGLTILFFLLVFILITAVLSFCVKDIPFISMPPSQEERWSIGIGTFIYENGRLKVTYPECVQNPVFTAAQVTDRNALFVADPFLIRYNNNYYLFFEVFGPQGIDIGLAKSTDGIRWKYEKIVLDEPYNLSYPAIIEANGAYYMTPEVGESKTIRLYKSSAFPFEWRFVKTIAEGKHFVDPTIFYYQNKYWLFVSDATSSILYLFFADNIEGNWHEHPQSPIIKNDRTRSRPAGSIIIIGDKIIRPTQNDTPYYGRQVRLFEITRLTQTEYNEHELSESPILRPSGFGWNKDGMHQLSSCLINNNQWLIAVDGKYSPKNLIYIGKKKFTIPNIINQLFCYIRESRYKTLGRKFKHYE